MSDTIKIYGELENYTENGYVTDSTQVKTIVGSEIKSQSWLNNKLIEKSDSAFANTAYATCETREDVATKAIEVPGFYLSGNVRILVKMTYTNEVAENVVLQVNGENTHPLLYNNESVSASNTWAAGETLEVYYDSDQEEYQATTYGSAKFTTGEVVSDLGIDNVPTLNSDNLVTSGGVKEKLVDIDSSIYDLEKAVFPLEISLTNNKSDEIQEFTGANIPITLTWATDRAGKGDVVADSLILKNGDVTLYETTPSSHTGIYNTNINYLGTTTFTATATLDILGETKTATSTITQYLPCYIGFYEGDADVDTMKSGVGALTRELVSNVSALSGVYHNSKDDAYLTICIPSGFNISSVTSSGYNVPMQIKVADDSVAVPTGGQYRRYYIYRSASVINKNSDVSIMIYG